MSGHTDSAPTTRTATLADLDRIETLVLEDFAVDFSKVVIPEAELGERLKGHEVDGVVEGFLAGLREERRTR